MKRRTTYIATPRGKKVGAVLIALLYCGVFLLSAYAGSVIW